MVNHLCTLHRNVYYLPTMIFITYICHSLWLFNYIPTLNFVTKLVNMGKGLFKINICSLLRSSTLLRFLDCNIQIWYLYILYNYNKHTKHGSRLIVRVCLCLLHIYNFHTHAHNAFLSFDFNFRLVDQTPITFYTREFGDNTK